MKKKKLYFTLFSIQLNDREIRYVSTISISCSCRLTNKLYTQSSVHVFSKWLTWSEKLSKSVSSFHRFIASSFRFLSSSSQASLLFVCHFNGCSYVISVRLSLCVCECVSFFFSRISIFLFIQILFLFSYFCSLCASLRFSISRNIFSFPLVSGCCVN